MSAYQEYQTEFRDQACLVEALKACGYAVEVHKTPVQLLGYQGDKREQVAHVVVPRKAISAASNDVGFERLSNGTFRAHVSQFDKSRFKLNRVKQVYAKTLLVKRARAQGYRIREGERNGRITLTLMAGR